MTAPRTFAVGDEVLLRTTVGQPGPDADGDVFLRDVGMWVRADAILTAELDAITVPDLARAACALMVRDGHGADAEVLERYLSRARDALLAARALGWQVAS